MSVLYAGVCILWGVATGIIISTGILSFINAIGIIPRLATKAKVTLHYFAFANVSLLGVITGTILYIWDIYLPIPKIIIAFFGLAFGVFVGCLSIAIAEILDVIPISKSRLKLKRGAYMAVLAFAFGKMIGTLFYYLYPGFH